MEWLAFAYSLPEKRGSSRRVALWRRIRQLGAVAPKGRIYILPARDDCVEAFQWLAREVEGAGGEAVLMRVQRFEGISERDAILALQRARARDYRELAKEAARLEKVAGVGHKRRDSRQAREALVKLRKRHADIARIDFFDAPEGAQLLSRLDRLEGTLAGTSATESPVIPARRIRDYRGARWITRPRPHVDRLACAWLIRRFINAAASIRYDATPDRDEIPFDMDRGEFSHRGTLCTFEVMVKAFAFDQPALQAMGELVHEVDLRDGRYAPPEAPGIDAILEGWRAAGLTDTEMEARGIALFEALFLFLTSQARRSVRERP